MPRIFIPYDRLEGCESAAFPLNSVRLRGEAVRRLTRVLRLRPGERFSIIDDRETEHDILIESITPHEVAGRRLASRKLSTDPKVRLTVLQGVPKGQKLDVVVRECAELGVCEVVPVITARTVPHLGELERDRRHERWQKISQQAAEQCGRASIMRVKAVTPFAEALPCAHDVELKLLFYEGNATPLREYLTTHYRPNLLSTNNARAAFPSAIAILIGPEGGFTSQEVDQAAKSGFIPVSLGRRILRTETVAPIVAGLLLFLFEDL